MEDITITPEEFGAVLAEFVKFGVEEKKEAVHDGIKKITREAKKEVETKSPESDKKYSDPYSAGNGLRRTTVSEEEILKSKHYKDSWATTATITEERGVSTLIVHNKKWQLVHLLEDGHLTRKGTGRTAGTGKDRTKAFSHVEPVQKNAEEKVDALLESL